MSDPDIWDRIKKDGQELSEFCPMNGLYYTVRNKNEVMGLALFEWVNPYLYRYHPMVLKEFRRHSKEFHKAAIDNLRKEVGYVSIVAEFPACFRDIRLALKRNKFKELCRIKDGAGRNGERCDMILAQYEG